MGFSAILGIALTGLALFSISNASPARVDTSALRRSPGRIQGGNSHILIDPDGNYPRVTALKDGSLLAGYAARDRNGTDQVLRVARYTANDASWTRIGEVARVDFASHDMDNAMPLQLPGGRVLYAFRNHDRVNNVYTFYRLLVCFSDDQGRSWQYLSTIEERVANGSNGVWEPFLRLAKDGSVQVYYSGELAPGDQNTYMKYSRDSGATWSSSAVVSGGDTTASRDGMAAVAQIDASGTLICVFENTETGRFSIDYVVSGDDGMNWAGRTRLYTALNERSAGAPYVQNVGGTIVVSFMTNELANGGDVNNVDGGQMKIVTSNNGMKSWTAPFTAGAFGSHWPGLFSNDATNFMAVSSLDNVGVISQVFTLVN